MVSDLTPGQPWTVPVTSFLVDHPRGRLLFDTGVHCQARIDPLTRLGPERRGGLLGGHEAPAGDARPIPPQELDQVAPAAGVGEHSDAPAMLLELFPIQHRVVPLPQGDATSRA